MTAPNLPDVLAIDLGSSRVKLGWFRRGGACASKPADSTLPVAGPCLPEPEEATSIEHRGRPVDAWSSEVDSWLEAASCDGAWCLVGSVHPKIAAALVELLGKRGFERVEVLRNADVPIEICTVEPARVGIDRILDAVAVNQLRHPRRPAIVVDMGTAVTVDLVSSEGAFEGGAIFAGPTLALAALHAGTASLPALDLSRLAQPPPSVGKSTEQALLAGAYWSAAGAVRELMRRTAESVGGEPELYLTGGGAPGYADILHRDGRRPRFLPHLALSGIRLVAEELAR